MNSNSKICIVANTAWSIYNFRQGVIKKLIASGYEVVVIAPIDDSIAKIEALGCSFVHLAMDPRGVNPISDLLLIIRLFRIYRTLQPSIIFHYTIKPNIYGSIAAKLARLPALAITTGLGYTFLNNNLIAKMARGLYKFAFKFPKEVWFLNHDDMSVFHEMNLVNKSKTKLLHSEGIDTNYYTPMKTPDVDKHVRFLLIARMLWDKGVGEYVQAAEIVKQAYPDTIFQLLGACGVANPSMIEREQVDKWVGNGVVEYLGVTNDVRDYISRSDCVVLPSYREGVPRTLLEAASMGKPLIATDVPGCRDVVVDGKTGFVCKVKDPQSLANSCLSFLGLSAQDKRNMGLSGRQFMVETFDEKIIVEQYMDALKRLVG